MTKKSQINWLATSVEDGYSQVLAGKLKYLNSSALGSDAALHYNNVGIAYTHLYGFDIEGVGANAALITRSGPNGSVAELRVPAAAGDLAKAWNIVVGPELTWSAVPSTTDAGSEAEAINARNALQYYWEQVGVESKFKAAMFYAMGLAECAIHIPWDTNQGEVVTVDPETQQLVHAGDMDFRVINTWDILRDPAAKSYDAQSFALFREWHNKFDEAATCKTKEQAEACLSASSTVPIGQTWVPFQASSDLPSDSIPVYYLYAKMTPSVPAGRETVFLEDGTILFDGPLREAYQKQLPFVRVAAGEYRGTSWPHTKFFGVLGAQQASDALLKDLLTNATAVSGPIVSVEDDNVDGGAALANMGGGPQLVTRPKGSAKPEVLQIQSSHPEHFNLLSRLRNDIQQIIGIDNITAGQEVGANLSGAAMALLTSTSVQNNSQLQSVWTEFVQTGGTVVLKHIQFHMKQPRKIALAGAARSGLVALAELSGPSVKGIDRVMATIGSALQQTDAGKYEIATTSRKEGWAKTPEQFQTVLDTGRLDALTQDLSNELVLISQENEALGRGETVDVMLGDDHVLHLKSHRFVTANLTARRNPAVVQALQAHEAWHLRTLRETDPQLLQIFGQPSLGAGAANGNVESGGAAPPPPDAPGAPATQQQAQADAPTLPKNPATGQPAGPVAGTVPPALAVNGAKN